MDPSSLKRALNGRVSASLDRFGYTPRMKYEAKREAWWWLEARGSGLARGRGIVAGSAVLYNPQGYAELVPIEVPLAGTGEITVEVLSSAISPGTERAQYLRLPNTGVKGPHRPGYSAAGKVIAVGRGVHGLDIGETVAVRDARHASVTTVAAAHAFRVPEGVTVSDAALVKLAIISGQAVRLARIQPGEPVCVVGAGIVGLLAQRLAVAAGAGDTYVVAASRSKEALARRGNVTHFFVGTSDAGEIARIASPVVIEATGDPDAIGLAVAAAGDGGRLVLLGSPRGSSHDLPVSDIRAKSLWLTGAHVETLAYEQRRSGEDGQRRAAEAYLHAIQTGSLTVSDLATHTVDPRDAGNFYRMLARDRGIVGARFNWAAMPRDQRVRRARLLRVPDLTGRGIEISRAPLQSRRAHVDDADPFADATGCLRIGMLGCGDIAVQNAAAVADAPNAQLVACYDPALALGRDLAGAHGAKVASSAEELIEHASVDAVFISVPHHLHAPLAVLAASRGKHVIVEKPPAIDLAATLDIVAAAEREGVHLSFCFPQRFQPSAVAARRLVLDGAIGEFGGLSARLLLDRAPHYWCGGFSGRSVSSWRESREQAGGGVLIMNLSHYIDLMRHLAGVEVEEVSAFTSSADRPGEIEDTVTVGIRFSNGAVGSLFGSTAIRGTFLTEFQLWGRDGHLVVEPEPRVYSLTSMQGYRTSRWQDLGPLPANRMRTIFVSRFASAVTRSESPDIGPTDGLAAQAFIEAAYRSAELGQAIRPSELLQEALA